MEVPQSPSPSVPPRLCDIAAYWDVAALCSGAVGLHDIVAAGHRGHGAMGLRGIVAAGRCGPWPRRRRVAVWSWVCRRGRILGAPTALWGCGASWLWGIVAVGHGRFGTPPSVRSWICLRGAVQKGAPRQGVVARGSGG